MIYIALRCDKCRGVFEVGCPRPNVNGTITMIRHDAKKKGWSHRHGSTIDLCHDCQPIKKSNSRP